MTLVVFSIDNVTDLHTLAKFLHYMDTKRATMSMKGNLIQCIGSYEGKLELSFLVTEEDYRKHVIPSGYIDNQESVMVVCEQTYSAYFKSISSTWYSNPKRLREVSKKEAMQSEGWTYRPDLDVYWVC